MVVSNTGPGTSTAVVLTNPLPFGATFVSATSSQGTVTNLGSEVVCELPFNYSMADGLLYIGRAKAEERRAVSAAQS